jgi:hypothetical protein
MVAGWAVFDNIIQVWPGLDSNPGPNQTRGGEAWLLILSSRSNKFFISIKVSRQVYGVFLERPSQDYIFVGV